MTLRLLFLTHCKRHIENWSNARVPDHEENENIENTLDFAVSVNNKFVFPSFLDLFDSVIKTYFVSLKPRFLVDDSSWFENFGFSTAAIQSFPFLFLNKLILGIQIFFSVDRRLIISVASLKLNFANGFFNFLFGLHI